MRRWWSVPAVLAALLLAGAAPASAEPPSRVGAAVEDRAGVLAAGDAGRIAEATGRLRDTGGLQLFVVYVDSFDGADPVAWADGAARLSQLGVEDVLLAVAVRDGAYGTSVDLAAPVADSTVAAAERAAEQRLAAGDWAGGAIAFADGLGGAGSGSGLALGAAVVGGAALVGGGAYLLARRRRSGPVPAPAPPDGSDVATDDLAHLASAALLEVDEAVRTSEAELSAARAHFGDGAVAAFAAAVEASRTDLVRAFGLHQQLDDDVPEDEPARRALCTEIVRTCRAADERLDDQVAAFDALRDLEARAPGYVAGLGARRVEVQARLPQATATWTELAARYAPAALEPVAGHLDRARELLAAAAPQIDAAGAELAAGRRAAAVVAGRAAEDALTQAGALLDGLPRRGAELADAATRLPAARAETAQDLAEARVLVHGPVDGAPADPDLAPVVARAEAALTAAAEQEARDPIAALRLVDEAGAALDAAVADARADADRARRAAGALEQTLVTARAAVAAADDYVAARRGAVGTAARTRLAEAQRHLRAATAGGDPAAALQEARHAEVRADEALSLARQDASDWSAGPAGSGLGAELGSLVLGGILSGALRGGGGFGSGGPGGGLGGGGRSRGGGGPGSFGGTRSRGRRGGGGRF